MKQIEITEDTTVRVARAPNATKRIVVEEGDTVEIVINKTGRPLAKNEEVAVNGKPAAPETPVKAGDTVVASQGAKGA